jgi:FkbM family methyltransferase
VNFRPLIRKFLHRFGLDISKIDRTTLGQNPWLDMERFVVDSPNTVLFDVGANIGQSIARYRMHFPKSQIHSFEPSPQTYRQLQTAAAGDPKAKTWNFAFGPAPGKAMLNENKHSVMNSLLELGESGWGEVEKRTEVDVRTIDEFCAAENIHQIDALKSDAQGYDLEVFKGAEQMMRDNRIGLVLCEVNFVEFYRQEATFDQIFRFMMDRNFAVVSFYQMHYGQNIVTWTDVLFINKTIHAAALKETA